MTADVDDKIPILNSMYRLQWEQAQDSHVLLYPEGMVKLSASAAEILGRVDGKATIGTIVSDLKDAFDGADLRDDVVKFLHQASENGWIDL